MTIDQTLHIASMKGSYQSPLGYINFETNARGLYHMSFDDKPFLIDDDPMINHIISSLDRYFKGELKTFDVPIHFNRGTVFQKDVWYAMLKIPFGETKSYQDIADMINNPKAVRAVGQACKRNPVGIIVPCHRVIGKNKALTGYSGKQYIGLKKELLLHEGVDVIDKRTT